MLKNNKIALKTEHSVCEAQDDKPKTKIKLCTLKARNQVKAVHPLTNRRVKLHKLKFAEDIAIDRSLFMHPENRSTTFTKRFRILSGKKRFFWTTEYRVVDWLMSIGIHVKRLPHGLYIVDGKRYNLSSIVVMANKQRALKSLPLFYLEDLTEN